MKKRNKITKKMVIDMWKSLPKRDLFVPLPNADLLKFISKNMAVLKICVSREESKVPKRKKVESKQIEKGKENDEEKS